VAAGNETSKNGISSPACAPGAVSVGAVYDDYMGAIAWEACTDSSTAPDQVTCFSNSSSYLTLLAPGAIITAAGIGVGGTSQAAPHVAGAVAVLRAAFQAETLEQTVSRMTNGGVPVADPYNGLTHPRLDLVGAINWQP
jgi:subtilisin family serine protease